VAWVLTVDHTDNLGTETGKAPEEDSRTTTRFLLSSRGCTAVGSYTS
jgi:hypothetical protein